MNKQKIKILYVYPHDICVIDNRLYHPYLNQIIERYKYISNDITCIISNRQIKNFKSIDENTAVKQNTILIDKLTRINNIFFLQHKTILDEVRKCDVLITKLPSFEGVVAVKYALMLNKRVLVEMVGCPWDSFFNHSLKGKIIAPYITFLTKKYIKRANYVQYVSNKFLQERYPTNAYKIGCSDVKVDPVDSGYIQNKYLNFEKKHIVILSTLGAIDVKVKGQEEVIKLLPYLNNGTRVFEYHLAGSGDKKRLEKLAKSIGVEDKVKFLGLLDKENVNKFLDYTDIYIQPSKTEGLSRSLIEAMSRGCFCIASNAGGNVELVSDKYVYKVSKPKGIINIINNLTEKELIESSNYNFNFSLQFQENILKFKLEKLYDLIINDVKYSK